MKFIVKIHIKQIILLFLIFFLIYFFIILYNYHYFQKKNEKIVSQCTINSSIEECYVPAYQMLIPKMLVHDVKLKESQDLTFEIFYPSYFIPTVVLEKADSMVSYGMWIDTVAEEEYSLKYNRDIYAFDCGIESLSNPISKCHFESSCIGTDRFILTSENQVSSGKIHSFGQKLKELNLEDKKFFIKMDIAGAESDVLEDIVKYHDNILALSIVFHFENVEQLLKDINNLNMLEKNFVLVSRADHRYISCHLVKFLYNVNIKYMTELASDMPVLTFINKDLVEKTSISWNQTADNVFENENTWKRELNPMVPADLKYTPTKISRTVVLYEKLKTCLKRAISYFHN